MSSKIKVTPTEVRLVTIWMLQPDYPSFRHALEDKGYVLKGMRSGATIHVATKGSIEVVSNIERRTTGVESEKSTRDLQVAQEDLEQIYLELGIEENNLLTYEFTGSFIASSTRSPLGLIKSFNLENNILQKIGSVLDEDIVPVGLKLTNKEGNPTSKDWLQIAIEPLYPTANKRYQIHVIYRGEKGKVNEFIKKIEKNLSKIIEKLEETK